MGPARACRLKLVGLAENRDGYGNLCALITRARRAAGKGRYRVEEAFLRDGLPDCLVLYVPERSLWRERGYEPLAEQGRWVRARFPERAWIGVGLTHEADDAVWLAALERLSSDTGLRLVAAGDVFLPGL